MNSSLNSSESNSAPNQQQTNMQATEGQNPSSHAASTDAKLNWQRLQPIPPPSEPMQYRAIGLVRGRYIASEEQFTQGTLLTEDGTNVSAVLLGRIISLLKNHIDLAQEHLWVVYPRTGQKEDNLHLQIVGVWEPEKLTPQPPEGDKSITEKASQDPVIAPEDVVENYFSVRGEVVYQSTAEGHFIVKIRQVSRTQSDKPKYFKLKILGDLATKAVGQFWDLQVERKAETLVLDKGESVAPLPPVRPKLRKKPYNAPASGTKRNFEPPQPVRKTNVAPPIKQPARSPAPKPIKRQNPSS